MKLAIAAALVLLSNGLTASAQETDVPKPMALVSFQFDRPGLEVPKFTLQVNEDGSARYEADQVYPPPRGSDSTESTTRHIDRTLMLTPATTKRIFAAAHELNRFTDVCASNLKNIADTGKKTLSYTGEGGDGSCTYNYSQDKSVTLLTNIFQGIAFTLDMGRKLDFQHRFDRLGLDATTASLASETDAGRAVELGTIAPTLRSIADDSNIMERVRLRAAKLLQQFPPPA